LYILGISAFYHDSAACIVKDGIILAAAQEERFTRKKHDHRFPIEAIKFCFEYAGIRSSDLSYVTFYDKPFLKFERILETYFAYAPKGLRSFIKAMPLWLKEKLWIKEVIKRELDYKGEILFTEHHQSHAASAFFPSPFEEAAVLTVDGVGEWTTTSYGIGKGNNVSLYSELKFPHSLGLFYSAFTYYTGFRVNSGEYKVMGLAPYGEPKYVDLIYKELIDLKEDGSFKLNMDYFNYCAGLTMTNKKFDLLFGGHARKPESKLTQREMDLARSVQEVTNEIILRIAKHIKRETGQKNLCLAGGVALNCVANGLLLKEKIFDDIWIQPAAGDAGGALGAAVFTWYQFLNNERKVEPHKDFQQGSYLGPVYSDETALTFMKEHDVSFEKLEGEEFFNKIADLLNDEKVIGLFQGRMEFGPRALGARSIIGDARSSKMQSKMNLKIKFRESFRPFAPSVLENKISDYFEIDRPSPYMLLVADVRSKRRKSMTEEEQRLFGIDKLNIVRSDVPAITHIDYSARIQSVSLETNPFYYKLIEAFDKKYKCAVIINTSFNVRGEPIVGSLEDAFRCFMQTDMDYLIINNFIIDKEKNKALAKRFTYKQKLEMD
jgi:carbamoyltransferase